MADTLSLMPLLERAPHIKYITNASSMLIVGPTNSKQLTGGAGPISPSLPKGLKRAVIVVRFMHDLLVPHPYDSLLLVRRVFRAHQLRDACFLLASWYVALSGVWIFAARNALQETVEG